MDNKKFFEEIRKIIREEVNLAINKKDIPKSTINSFKEEIQHGMKLQNEVKLAGNTSGKPTIQDLLNETKQSMLSGDNTLSFTSADAQNFRGNMAQMLGYGEASAIPRTDIEGRPVQNLDPATEKALTRNYSSVMKALKEKKK